MPKSREIILLAVAVIGAALWVYGLLMCLGVNPLGIHVWPGFIGGFGVLFGVPAACEAVAAWKERRRPWKR